MPFPLLPPLATTYVDNNPQHVLAITVLAVCVSFSGVRYVSGNFWYGVIAAVLDLAIIAGLNFEWRYFGGGGESKTDPPILGLMMSALFVAGVMPGSLFNPKRTPSEVLSNPNNIRLFVLLAIVIGCAIGSYFVLKPYLQAINGD